MVNVNMFLRKIEAQKVDKGVPEGKAMAKVIFTKNSAGTYLQNNGYSILGRLLEGAGLYREYIHEDDLKAYGFTDDRILRNPDTALTYGIQTTIEEIKVIPRGLTINFDNNYPFPCEGHEEPQYLEEVLESMEEALQARAMIVEFRVARIMLDMRELTPNGEPQNFGRFSEIEIVGVYPAEQPGINRGLSQEKYAERVLEKAMVARENGVDRRRVNRPMTLDALIETRGQESKGQGRGTKGVGAPTAASILERRRTNTTAGTAGAGSPIRRPVNPPDQISAAGGAGGTDSTPQLPTM